MPQWVLGPKDFIKGIAISEELGGFWDDQIAIDTERATDNNTVGVLRSGYASSNIGTLTTLPLRVAKSVQSSTNTGNMLLFAGGLSTYRVDSGNIMAGGSDTVTNFNLSAISGAYTGVDRGVGYLSSVSGNSYWLAATLSAGVDRLVQYWNIISANPNATGFEASAFAGSNVPHPSFLKNNILWWGDGNQLAKLTTDTGLTLNVLDIPLSFVIQSVSEYDKYLAIGATNRNSATSTESKLFLWDMISDSWNFEYSVPYAILKLENERGTLYVYGTDGVDFIVSKFNGTSIEHLHTQRNPRLGLRIPFNVDAIDIFKNKHFLSLRRVSASTYQGVSVGSLGSFLPMETLKFDMPFMATSANSTGVSPGALIVGDSEKIYQAYQSGSTYGLSVFNSGNQVSALGTTIELDSYLGGNANLKKLNFVRFEFDPLASGDQVDLYDFVDYEFGVISANSSTASRLDDSSSVGVNNSIRFSDLGAETSKTFMLGKQFRQYRLGINFVAGNTRIRKIIIDYSNVESTGQ